MDRAGPDLKPAPSVSGKTDFMSKKRLIKFDVVTSFGAVLGLVILTIISGVVLVQADGPNQVGLVVVHGDGEIIKKCIEFSENEINGYDVLERAGLDTNTEADGGMGAAICSIDNEGCTYPEEECFCQCSGGETCVFWSYWYLRDGSWQFSPMGASGHSVQHGDVEGWVWGGGSPEGGAASAPNLTFADICQPPATNTPSPTHTPRPTDTPTPTPTATNTPEPKEKPVIHHFSADRTEITAGQVVQLSWDLSEADAAYLRYNRREEGVISPGSKNVSPTESTVFTLAAQNSGGETIAQITITVNDAPAPASTPIPTATPVPVAVGLDSPLTATPGPEPVINFNAASSTLPPGACTNIQWSVEPAEAVFLNDTPVEPAGGQQACPAKTQIYELRAAYPGGEKIVKLTLTVTETGIAPTDTPIPAGTSAQTATATPAVVSIVSTSVPETPTGPRRFTVSLPKDDSRSGGILWTGAALTAAGLFIIAPLGLIIAGWLAWWFRGKNR